MNDDDVKWVLMESFDAGARKEVVPGFEQPRTYVDAWDVLQKLEAERPYRDFLIRRLADVVSIR
jgi:hypothetical protein